MDSIGQHTRRTAPFGIALANHRAELHESMGAGRFRRLSRQLRLRGAWEPSSSCAFGLECQSGVAFCFFCPGSGRLSNITSLGAVGGTWPAQESALQRLACGEEPSAQVLKGLGKRGSLGSAWGGFAAKLAPLRIILSPPRSVSKSVWPLEEDTPTP